MMIQDILKQIYPINQHNVIIADGEFPHNKYLHQIITSATTIISCDGATKKLLNYSIIPDYIIGDCDSLTIEIKKQLHNKIIQISEQDTNDLTKAINLAQQLELDNLVILGATGLREDHTIANISLLVKYAAQIKQIALISDYGIFTIHNGREQIKVFPGQQVSFFTLTPDTNLTCKELKWPLNKHKFESWYQGTLNEATHNHLDLITNNKVIVFRAFEL